LIWFSWGALFRSDTKGSVRCHVRLSYDLWTSWKNLFCQCDQKKKRKRTRTLQRTSVAYSKWMDSKMAHEIRPTQINRLLVFSRLTNGLPLWFLIFFFFKFFFFSIFLHEIIIKTNWPVIILHVFIGVIFFSCPRVKTGISCPPRTYPPSSILRRRKTRRTDTSTHRSTKIGN